VHLLWLMLLVGCSTLTPNPQGDHLLAQLQQLQACQ
jgi:hypothetical protein